MYIVVNTHYDHEMLQTIAYCYWYRSSDIDHEMLQYCSVSSQIVTVCIFPIDILHYMCKTIYNYYYKNLHTLKCNMYSVTYTCSL